MRLRMWYVGGGHKSTWLTGLRYGHLFCVAKGQRWLGLHRQEADRPDRGPDRGDVWGGQWYVMPCPCMPRVMRTPLTRSHGTTERVSAAERARFAAQVAAAEAEQSRLLTEAEMRRARERIDRLKARLEDAQPAQGSDPLINKFKYGAKHCSMAPSVTVMYIPQHFMRLSGVPLRCDR